MASASGRKGSLRGRYPNGSARREGRPADPPGAGAARRPTAHHLLVFVAIIAVAAVAVLFATRGTVSEEVHDSWMSFPAYRANYEVHDSWTSMVDLRPNVEIHDSWMNVPQPGKVIVG